MTGAGQSRLRQVLDDACAAAGGADLDELTVQAPNNDPFRCDTGARRAWARWFAEQIARHVPRGDIHLRALHYRLVGSALLPDGKPYVNNFTNWAALIKAAQFARWLGFIDFARIADGRNADPEILTRTDSTYLGRTGITVIGGSIQIPSLDYSEIRPLYYAVRPGTRQPYRIILMGEKSSLRSELLPVAERVYGELLLPSGDPTDSMLAAMAGRAAEDGRPVALLYFADFDPSGWHMPIAVARRLQALIEGGFFPDLKIRVHRVALTRQQCVAFDLPSSVLKETERRGDQWRADTSREQTEVDALIGQHPGELRRIAAATCRPFFDPSLEERAQTLATMFEIEGRKRLMASDHYAPACAILEQAKADVAVAIDGVWAAAKALESAKDLALGMLRDLHDENFAIPVPEPETSPPPEALFDSDDDYATATAKLIANKRAAGQ